MSWSPTWQWGRPQPLKLICYLCWAFTTKAVSEAHGKTMIPWWQNWLAQGDEMPSNIQMVSVCFPCFKLIMISGILWKMLPPDLLGKYIMHCSPPTSWPLRFCWLISHWKSSRAIGPFVLETECGYAAEYVHCCLQGGFPSYIQGSILSLLASFQHRPCEQSTSVSLQLSRFTPLHPKITCTEPMQDMGYRSIPFFPAFKYLGSIFGRIGHQLMAMPMATKTRRY